MKSITMRMSSPTIATWPKWIFRMDSTAPTFSTRCSYSETLLEIYTCCWLDTVELVSRGRVSRLLLQRLKMLFKSTTLYSNRKQVMNGLLLLLANLWKLRRSTILSKFITQTLSTKITLPHLILTTASRLKVSALKWLTFWKQFATSLCTSERFNNRILTLKVFPSPHWNGKPCKRHTIF